MTEHYCVPQPKPARRVAKPRRRIRTRRPAGTVRREAKARGGVDPDTWQAIIEFYEYKCAFCGEPWKEQGHGKALAHGGEHSAANVFPLCHACNQSQGTQTRFPERRHPWMVGENGTRVLSCEKWNA